MRTTQHALTGMSSFVKKTFTSVTPRQDTLLSWPASTPETKLLEGELFFTLCFSTISYKSLLIDPQVHVPDKIRSRLSPALSARILSHTLQLKSSYPGEWNESTYVFLTTIVSTYQYIISVET